MIFGLPWFAIIPLVAIIGGLIYSYKEQQLKYAAKAKHSADDLKELHEVIKKLTRRIENLETIAAAGPGEETISVDDLEIDNHETNEERNTSNIKNKLRE